MTPTIDTRIAALVHPQHGRADACVGRIPHAETHAEAAEIAEAHLEAAWWWWVAGRARSARHAVATHDAELRYGEDWADHEGLSPR